MKFNKWTVALAAIGVVNLTSAARADDNMKMSSVQTALSNTTLSGYVDTAAIWNLGPNSPEDGTSPNLPPTTASGGKLQDGFQLNVVDLVLDKPEDESPWASGYHVEFQTGPDAVGAGGITQAYLTLRTPVGNGIDWKMGVFDTIVGYESLNDPANPNYTRSYAYQIEPTTHTGILGTYKVSDMVTVQAGVADTSNLGDAVPGVNGRPNVESQKTYMGDVSLTAPDSWGWVKGATLYVGAINSVNTGSSGPGSTSLYVGATVPTPMAALKMGGSFDYADYHDSGPGNPSDDSVWDIALYSTYQASEKLSLNFRAEYLNASQFAASNAEEFTVDAQYSLWANVLSRVEFRWDHNENGDNGFFGGYGASGTHSNNFLLAANLIYQF
jgi:Putative beta-barrel porin-2, OmpL-like. bbp2